MISKDCSSFLSDANESCNNKRRAVAALGSLIAAAKLCMVYVFSAPVYLRTMRQNVAQQQQQYLGENTSLSHLFEKRFGERNR